jgi:DNA-directed RNA polymerase specialized sigma subunit
MILSEEQNKYILEHLHLARIEAARLTKVLNRNFDDLYPIGYMALIDIALTKLDKIQDPKGPYSLRAIRYSIFDFNKKESKYETYPPGAMASFVEEFNGYRHTTSTEISYQDRYSFIKDEILDLSPQEQRLVKALYYTEFNIKQASKRIRIPYSRGYTMFYRIVDKLRFNNEKTTNLEPIKTLGTY